MFPFHLSHQGRNARINLVKPVKKEAALERYSPRDLPLETHEIERGLAAITGDAATVEKMRFNDDDVDLARVGMLVENSSPIYVHPETKAPVRDFRTETLKHACMDHPLAGCEPPLG